MNKCVVVFGCLFEKVIRVGLVNVFFKYLNLVFFIVWCNKVLCIMRIVIFVLCVFLCNLVIFLIVMLWEFVIIVERVFLVVLFILVIIVCLFWRFNVIGFSFWYILLFI